jgi:hypothetical protein
MNALIPAKDILAWIDARKAVLADSALGAKDIEQLRKVQGMSAELASVRQMIERWKPSGPEYDQP